MTVDPVLQAYRNSIREFRIFVEDYLPSLDKEELKQEYENHAIIRDCHADEIFRASAVERLIFIAAEMRKRHITWME